MLLMRPCQCLGLYTSYERLGHLVGDSGDTGKFFFDYGIHANSIASTAFPLPLPAVTETLSFSQSLAFN